MYGLITATSQIELTNGTPAERKEYKYWVSAGFYLRWTTVHLPVTMRPATIGIVSIGDMGLGMARLLKAHNYRVVTVAEGRRYGQIRGQTKIKDLRSPASTQLRESAQRASRPSLRIRTW